MGVSWIIVNMPKKIMIIDMIRMLWDAIVIAGWSKINCSTSDNTPAVIMPDKIYHPYLIYHWIKCNSSSLTSNSFARIENGTIGAKSMIAASER